MNPGTKYLTLDEIRRLTVAIDNKKDKLLIQMGLCLGCRVSEICSVQLRHIRGRVVRIWDEKKDQYRDCVLDQETADMIQDYLQTDWKPRRSNIQRLFYFHAVTANRRLKRLCADAGIEPAKAHWHTLRHTYVVQSLDAGIPLNHVCAQTGDSPNTIIKVYGQPSIDSRERMLDETPYWKVQK